MRTRNKIAAAVAVPLVLGGVACTSSKNSAVQADKDVTNTQMDRYQKNQPVPSFDWSQFRETAIGILSAQANTVATTTFFYNMGIERPDSCPSIGYPLPSTTQLTNPEQAFDWGETSSTVGQAEPNGTYTGSSDGTYVLCIAPDGTKYPQYWEGNVKTVGGPAHWEAGKGVVIDGKPTVQVKTK